MLSDIRGFLHRLFFIDLAWFAKWVERRSWGFGQIVAIITVWAGPAVASTSILSDQTCYVQTPVHLGRLAFG